MSIKRSKVEADARGGGGITAPTDTALPTMDRLVPFSFSENEIAPIRDRLPEIHDQIAEVIRNVRRKKDLREALRTVAYRYMKPSKYKSNMCFWYMEAYCILLLYAHPDSNERKVTMEQFLLEFPEFQPEAPEVQGRLFDLRNLLYVIFPYIPPENNRGHLLDLATRMLEGQLVKYVTGSGASSATRQRVALFEKLFEKDRGDMATWDQLFDIIQQPFATSAMDCEAADSFERPQHNFFSDIRGHESSALMHTESMVGMSDAKDCIEIVLTPSWPVAVSRFCSEDSGGMKSESSSLSAELTRSCSAEYERICQSFHEGPEVSQKMGFGDCQREGSVRITHSPISASSEAKRQRVGQSINAMEVLKRAAFAFQIENLEKFKQIKSRLFDLFNIFDTKASSVEIHKALLEFAVSVGVDPDVPVRKNEELLLIQACLLEYVSELRVFENEFIDMETFLTVFPVFVNESAEEKLKLLNWHNKLKIALHIIPARGNKGCLLKLLAKLLEGPRQEYILGTGALKETRNRLHLYHILGEILPNKIYRMPNSFKPGEDVGLEALVAEVEAAESNESEFQAAEVLASLVLNM